MTIQRISVTTDQHGEVAYNDPSGEYVYFVDAEADKVQAVADAVAVEREKTTELRIVMERCLKWRATDVHAAAIKLGVRDGDPERAERRRQDAERALRIAVDDRKVGRPIEPQDSGGPE